MQQRKGLETRIRQGASSLTKAYTMFVCCVMNENIVFGHVSLLSFILHLLKSLNFPLGTKKNDGRRVFFRPLKCLQIDLRESSLRPQEMCALLYTGKKKTYSEKKYH